jgi:hypothetical protein
MANSQDRLFGIILGFCLLPLSMIYYGFVLSIMWAWFVCPSLGAPKLSIPAAIGISLVVGMLTSHPENEKSAGRQVVESALFTTVVLFMGWLVHFAM